MATPHPRGHARRPVPPPRTPCRGPAPATPAPIRCLAPPGPSLAQNLTLARRAPTRAPSNLGHIREVYLKAHADHEEEPVTQLKSEVRHIQEAGSALKKLREDLSTKLQTQTEFLEFWDFREFQESSEEDPKALRLLWRLQEAEKWHQLERSSLENLEMHDQIEHLIEKQQTRPTPEATAPDPSGGNLNFGVWAQPDPSPSE
ncbi:uncharacterized protein LOC129124298 [Agelaius phoeniceus]|uniref:uncharacterized protein LOC129124298 n=1 Tax=Agelaius phoeniceus TaxID=39638 RepID=UPI00405525C1